MGVQRTSAPLPSLAQVLRERARPIRRTAGVRVRCDLQQLTFSQRRPKATASPGPGFGELPECLACVLMALSAASERPVRLIELSAQLRDGCAQEFELGALLIAQFDAPIPRLIGLSHRLVFAVRCRGPAARAPASHASRIGYPLPRGLDLRPCRGASQRRRTANPRLAGGALLGALLPVMGIAVIIAFNATYWLPIRGESPLPRT